MLSSITRTALRRAGHGSFTRATHSARLSPIAVAVFRPYATATRATTKTTATKTASKKPTSRTATKKPAAKKAAPKKKKKVVAKKAVKVRKPLSEAAKERKAASAKAADLRATRAKALLTEPKELARTAWTLYVTDNSERGRSGSAQVKELAVSYKNLSESEMASLRSRAAENKTKNDAEYKTWVESHTPLQIKDANTARDALRRRATATTKKTKSGPYHIMDERLVKGRRNALTWYIQQEMNAVGGQDGGARTALARIVQDYKSLSAGEKQKYKDLEEKDGERYEREYRSVYGIDLPASSRSSPSA